ncbi:MAG: M48 family metallopeptidase [Candidatus Omnitrophica bacterium]|nr:M48 family metallopeptidase [Candidatus Omnitrophota bacterium]
MTAKALDIPYQLVRSRRRTTALMISPDAVLTVRAPLHLPLARIESLITAKLDWINRKIAEQRSRPVAGVKLFAEGERFWYLGAEYALKISDEFKGSLVFENEFVLSARERGRAKELFEWWYKRTARRVITERVEFFSRQEGFRYNALKVTGARRRWGSCNTQGNLSFSWRLVMAPLEVIDYVVVHELVHLEHCDHSPRFWHRVRALYPQADQCRLWLKTHGPALDLV